MCVCVCVCVYVHPATCLPETKRKKRMLFLSFDHPLLLVTRWWYLANPAPSAASSALWCSPPQRPASRDGRQADSYLDRTRRVRGGKSRGQA